MCTVYTYIHHSDLCHFNRRIKIIIRHRQQLDIQTDILTDTLTYDVGVCIS